MCWNFLCPKHQKTELEEDLLTQSQESSTIKKTPRSHISPPKNIQSQKVSFQDFEPEQSEKIELLPKKSKHSELKKESRENYSSYSSSQYTQQIVQQQEDKNQRKVGKSTNESLKRTKKQTLNKSNRMNYRAFRKKSMNEGQLYNSQKIGITAQSFSRNVNEQFKTEGISEIESPTQFLIKYQKIMKSTTIPLSNESEYYKRLYTQSNQNQQYLYISTEIGKPIFFTYRMKYQPKEQLEHQLIKNRNKAVSVIGKPFMINTKLNILRKLQENIIIINYGEKPIINQFLANYEVIIVEDLSSVRFAKMDKIFILANKLQNFEEIYTYIEKMVKNLDFQDRKKIVYFFPMYLRLDQISELLYNIFSEDIAKMNTQKYVNIFNFEIEFPNEKNKENGITIQFKEENSSKKSANIYLNQVKAPLAIFGRYPNKFYTPLRQFFNFIKQFSMRDIINLKRCFSENKDQFFNRVREARAWDNYILMTNESEDNLLEKITPEYYFQTGEEFKIKKELREDISAFFQEQYKDPFTPIHIQWDDNLDQSDIKLAKKNSLSLHRDEHLDSIGNDEFQLMILNPVEKELIIFQDPKQNDLYASFKLTKDEHIQNHLAMNKFVVKHSDLEEDNIFKIKTHQKRKMSWGEI